MAAKTKSGLGSFIVLAVVVGAGIVLTRGAIWKDPADHQVHLHAEWKTGVAQSLRFQIHGAPATYVAASVLNQETWEDGVGVWDMQVSYTQGSTYSVVVQPPNSHTTQVAECDIYVDGVRMAHDQVTSGSRSAYCIIPQKS